MTQSDRLHAVRRIVDKVSLPGGDTHGFLTNVFTDSSVVYVQHIALLPDAHTGVVMPVKGRKWHISDHATESEIVLTCLKAAITAAEHEIREGFSYRGRRLFHPHPDINALLSIADEASVRL